MVHPPVVLGKSCWSIAVLLDGKIETQCKMEAVLGASISLKTGIKPAFIFINPFSTVTRSI